MPYYSDEILDEVRNANDVVDVISQYVQLKKKGNDYFGLCPFHTEKTGSFSVSRTKQMYYCFGCGAGGNVITFLRNYENLTFSEAVEQLAGRAGIALPQQEMSREQQERADRRSRILMIHKDAAVYFYKLLRSEHGKDAYDYFKKRELSDETMQSFGLGFAGRRPGELYKFLKSRGYEDDIIKDSGLVTLDEKRGGRDKFWNRAMFPIMDANSKVIAFGGRVMGEGEPKYLNSPETVIFDKSRTLYGLHLARKTRRKEMILCEGYMDVIALHQAGFDNAVASLGTSLTPGHAALLKRYTSDVYLSYDSDGAGCKAALRAIPILREAGLVCRVINMEPYKDPDEFIKGLGKDAYEERIAQAENAFMFSVRMEERKFDVKDPDAKTAFHRAIAAKILEFPEEIERKNYIDAVCRQYEISLPAMEQLVTHLAADGYHRRSHSSRQTDEAPKRRRRAGAPEGLREAQRLLLTRLCEAPQLYPQVRKAIDPEDFTEGLYRDVARMLFAQIEESGRADPAAIAERFREDEDQREIGAMFHTTIAKEESAEEQKKMLEEVVMRLLREGLNYKSQSVGEGGTSYNDILKEKKRIEQMQRGGIF
ncbi:MAG: DNA primase [Lachnospiraceae bacterium]|nr:DNA primase [Lachnospiraceae bacterium]